MKKMSYILLLGFLCCVFGGALCVLGYMRGGMDYVRAADALPQSMVERMEAAFSEKGKQESGAVSKNNISSADMEENGAVSKDGSSSADMKGNGAVSKDGNSSADMKGNGAVSKDSSSSVDMEESGAVSKNDSFSAGMEENGSSEDAVLKTGKDSPKYNFQLSKKKLQGFDAVQGDLKHVDMKIIPSDTKNAYIEYKLTAKKNSNPFSYQVKNSALTLSEKDGMLNSYYQNVRSGKVLEQRNTNLVTLYLPKKQLKSVTLTLGEGDISIKGLDTKTAAITLQDGDMWLEASTARGGSMKMKNGDFIFNKVICENCKFNSDNGDFQCSNFTVKKSELTAKNGDFIFDNSTSQGCKISSQNGDFQCKGFTMKNGTLSSANGDIDLLKSTITNCNVTTGCGDILVEGTTVSGKGISSDDGDLDFVRSVVKNCKIITDCGDIDGNKLKVGGNVTLVGADSDIRVTLEASCRTKVNIHAYTEDGSLEKSGKYEGKVTKKGDSRTYSRYTANSEAVLKIVTEDGDIILD